MDPPNFKVDPRFLSWIGASIIPKLDTSKDMYVGRDKYMASFLNYEKHLQKSKVEAIQAMKQQILAERLAELRDNEG